MRPLFLAVPRESARVESIDESDDLSANAFVQPSASAAGGVGQAMLDSNLPGDVRGRNAATADTTRDPTLADVQFSVGQTIQPLENSEYHRLFGRIYFRMSSDDVALVCKTLPELAPFKNINASTRYEASSAVVKQLRLLGDRNRVSTPEEARFLNLLNRFTADDESAESQTDAAAVPGASESSALHDNVRQPVASVAMQDVAQYALSPHLPAAAKGPGSVTGERAMAAPKNISYSIGSLAPEIPKGDVLREMLVHWSSPDFTTLQFCHSAFEDIDVDTHVPTLIDRIVSSADLLGTCVSTDNDSALLKFIEEVVIASRRSALAAAAAAEAALTAQATTAAAAVTAAETTSSDASMSEKEGDGVGYTSEEEAKGFGKKRSEYS